MNFKRIELIGFKSFADKTVIDFDGGITGIVGPNGCGKSNVADAVRWVLGEQSSKLLRGGSMQDVIFSGSEQRKSLSYCEVSLVLDNSNKDIKIEYDEVVLTRKLYRSGESEYLINKQSSRLKDLVDILHDSGIGKDGYTIIGQGKVEEIVSAKPEDRRSIFEEAAGIAKFKGKKLEAERKLERTRNNLSRVKDIIIEIENQLMPLREQAEVAKKYLEFKQDLKNYEINNYIYQTDNAESIKQQVKLKMNGLTEEINNNQTELDETVKKYNENNLNIQKIDLNIQELYNQVVSLNVVLERKSGETNVLKERLSLLKQEAQRLNNELMNEQQMLNDIDVVSSQKQEKRQSDLNEIEKLVKESKMVSEKYLNVVDELTKSEDEAELNQQQMINALDKLSEIKADLSRFNAEKLANNNLRMSLEEEITKIEQKVTEHSNELELKQTELSNFNAKKIELEQNEKTALKNQTDLQKTIENESEKLNELNSIIHSSLSRKSTIEDMQKNYDGFNGAVKQILISASQNDKIKKQLVGVVASLISVPEKYQTAIEMALGNATQNIVTESEENAKILIEYLKQNNFGRATFLPISSMKPHFLNADEFKNLGGCFGIASKLVKFDEKLSNVFENLLGATVIVDNLVTAINLAKKSRYAFKIVTLEGDIVNPQGSMTGGSKKNVVSLINRENEIAEITKNVEKLSKEKMALEQAISLNRQKFVEVNNNLKAISESLLQANVSIAKTNQFINQYNVIIAEEKKQIEIDKTEISKLTKTIELLNANLTTTDNLQSNINSNKNNANESISKRQEKFENLKHERDQYNSKNLEVKVKIAGLQSEIISLEREIENLKSEKEKTLKGIDLTKGQILSNMQIVEKAENVMSSQIKDEVVLETTEKLNVVKSKLSNLDSYKKSLQQELQKLEENRVQLSALIAKLQEKWHQEDLNYAKVDIDIQNMQEQIWNEYELTYGNAIQHKIEGYDLKKGLSLASKTRKEIEKLGYVNVNAIEDSKAYELRYADLNNQSADLIKAEEDLTKIISELASEMTTRFTTNFAQINENFKIVFKELFGGGHAELVLTETESGNVLDAGIDIIAEPPGKKLQNISLLSGGEKALTAIAILFSILKLRPVPFVLLDEIEAALDEANGMRFAKYLKRFSNETQFIVITHRKQTMEQTDCLYGVTMEEKGVSKIVSVKLSDALLKVKAGA